MPPFQKRPRAVLHEAFDLRLIPGMAHARRVQQEAAGLAVFQERPRRPRVERIGPSDRGREVVEHQALGAALKERPRLLEPLDGRLDRLLGERPQEAVAAVGQGDAETPDQLATARLAIEQQPQPLKIHLRHLTRRCGRHAHRVAAAAAGLEAQAPHEALEGGVRDVQAMLLVQQLLHARQLKMLILQPRRDLLTVRRQPISLRGAPRPPSADHPTRLDQPYHLVLGRRRPIGRQTQLFGGVQVLPHRLARHAAAAGDGTLRRAHLPAPNNLDDLHTTQLPIAHAAHLVVADMVMNRAVGGLMLRGDELA